MAEKLTQDTIKKAQPNPAKDSLLWDTDPKGFYLMIRKGGAKSFGVHYRTGDGKQRKVNLGDAYDLEGKCRLNEARQLAKEKIAKAKDEKIGIAPRGEVPALQEGFDSALGLTRARKQTQRQYQYQAAAFVAWVKDKHNKVSTFEHLKPSMLTAYALQMEQAGRKPDTIRLAVGFVRFAWERMAADFPDRVLQPPKVRRMPRDKQEVECLDPAHVAILFDWLKVNRPSLYPMAILQGLCGLRMLEAAALRVQDVNLKTKTITITETPLHKPKNPYSNRLIPIPAEAAVALDSVINGKVRLMRGEIFRDANGNPWIKPNKQGILDGNSLVLAWARSMKAISATPRKVKRRTGVITVHSDGLGNPAFEQIPARKLRAAFVSMAGRLGVPDRLCKGFIGHAPEDVLGRHYRKIELEELRAVARLMDGWRKLTEKPSNMTAEGKTTMEAIQGSTPA